MDNKKAVRKEARENEAKKMAKANKIMEDFFNEIEKEENKSRDDKEINNER